MSVGQQITKADIDNQATALARGLDTQLDRVAKFKAWLDARTTEDLVAYGYTEQEVAILKSAFGDLDLLREVYAGGRAQADVKDFRVFARHLHGFGF